jgi:hypothetical protein
MNAFYRVWRRCIVGIRSTIAHVGRWQEVPGNTVMNRRRRTLGSLNLLRRDHDPFRFSVSGTGVWSIPKGD